MSETRLRGAFERALGIPFTGPNEITRLKNGREIFPAMLDAVRKARKTIDFETFVYWRGEIAMEFAEALAEAAHRGCSVRVLLDAVGSIPMPSEIRDVLEESPVDVLAFRPPNPLRFWEIDHRSHRKILVCDDDVAFTGGVGIAREWEGDARSPDEWRETHFRIRGRAVHLLAAAFTRHWLEAWTEQRDPLEAVHRALPVLPEVDSNPPFAEGAERGALVQMIRSIGGRKWTDVRTLFATAIAAAEKTIRLTTAYFVPGPDTVELLCRAVERGVDVQVMLPGPHVDHRMSQLAGEAVYDELLSAGVTILRYQPTMLHVKSMTVDGFFSSIGSANFNMRSIAQDDEIVLNVIDPGLAAALDADFDRDREDCEVYVSSDEWRKRSLVQRAGEWAAGLVRDEL